MKKVVIYVVVDTETNMALRAFDSVEKANDYSDDQYIMGQDTIVSETWYYFGD